MSDITITKVSGPETIRKVNTTTGVPECTTRSIPDNTVITITNFSNIEMSLESPSGDFPIPETEDFGNIVVKAEGNRLVFVIGWVIKEEPSCYSITSDCTVDIHPVNTVAKQIDYWLNVFQPYSIEAKYKISIDGIVRIGFIRSIRFSKSANSPVTYDATLDFIAGDVVAGE